MNRTDRRRMALAAKRDATCARHGITREAPAFAAYFTRSRKSRSTGRA